MKTYLVETYSSEIEYDKGSIIVALTPEVCYQLDKKGVKYSIIEDYYDNVALSDQVGEYNQALFRWIDNFDAFLLKNIKGLELKLATIYRWYLKGMILDPLYLRCYAVQHLFKAIKPTEVTYIAPEPDEPHLSSRFEHYGRSLYSQVLPIICREKSVPLTTILTKPEKKENKNSKPVSQGGSLITRLKTSLYKSAMARRMYFTYRCLKKLPHLNQTGRKKLNIFLIRVSHIGEDFVAEALVRGHHIYLLSGDSILKYSYFGTRKCLNLKAEPATAKDDDWEKTANLLADSELIKWVNEKWQMDVSEITLSRLKHFTAKVCPELVSYIKQFIDFYKSEKIDLVFAPFVSYLEDYAAIAAVKSCPKIETAILIHGDIVYESRVWHITNLQNFNIHITTNNEFKDYLVNLSKEINPNATIYSSPHRLLNLKNIAGLREKRSTNAARKNRVIYLPGLMVWDAQRNDGDTYSDTWYYQFQKSLLKYFATRGDYTFVWKGLPQAEEIYDPIPDFIRDNHFGNIEIATNPFVEHLLTADRVIHDCPSTGFYEAVVAGVPTISIYPKSLVTRPSGVKYFEKLLRVFSDTSEAIRHIDTFLNSDAELYKMTIDTDDNSVIDIIEGIVGGEH